MRGRGERSAVVLDRHPLWLDAMRRLLEERVGVKVVGLATHGALALTLIQEHRPDLFVAGLDFGVADGNGLGCVGRARESCPGVRTVVVSAVDDPRTIEAAFAEGAAAYCLKTAEPDDLAAAIRQSFEHSIYIAGVRRPETVVAGEPTLRAVRDSLPELTRRELEILQLVAEGHSNLQLARMLWVTEQTVKFHLSNIYRKLNVSNRTEASRWAQLNGLLSSSPSARAAASPFSAA
jgi:DNA-binding NarL/FixJ family response regulator